MIINTRNLLSFLFITIISLTPNLYADSNDCPNGNCMAKIIKKPTSPETQSKGLYQNKILNVKSLITKPIAYITSIFTGDQPNEFIVIEDLPNENYTDNLYADDFFEDDIAIQNTIIKDDAYYEKQTLAEAELITDEIIFETKESTNDIIIVYSEDYLNTVNEKTLASVEIIGCEDKSLDIICDSVSKECECV